MVDAASLTCEAERAAERAREARRRAISKDELRRLKAVTWDGDPSYSPYSSSGSDSEDDPSRQQRSNPPVRRTDAHVRSSRVAQSLMSQIDRRGDRARKRPRQCTSSPEPIAEPQGGRWYGPERPADSAEVVAQRTYEAQRRGSDAQRRKAEAKAEPWAGGWSYTASPSDSDDELLNRWSRPPGDSPGTDDESQPDSSDTDRPRAVRTTAALTAEIHTILDAANALMGPEDQILSYAGLPLPPLGRFRKRKVNVDGAPPDLFPGSVYRYNDQELPPSLARRMR